MVNIHERPSGSGWISDGPERRTRVILAGIVLTAAAVGAVIMMRNDASDDSQTVTAAAGTAAGTSDGDTGTVRVQLEPVDGFFIEGFEVGLRFETADGEVIDSTLWSDHIASLDADRLEAYYESRLDQTVPAGPVVVRAEVTIGVGPPPSIPDLEGDLPCRLDLEVGPGEIATVEVSFAGGPECLKLRSEAEHTPPDPAADPDKERSSSTEWATASSAPTTSRPTAPEASTTSEISEPVDPWSSHALAVGSSHYVDVDLECEAFVLGGTWVLLDGDPFTWQPAGERHEGGTFTIESPGVGRFVGDAAQTKVATFRMMGPNEGAPACLPIPRPVPPG